MSTYGHSMFWPNFRGCIKTMYEYIYSLWNESFLLYCMRYLFLLRSFIRYITNTILVLVQESKTTICYTMRIDAGMICSILILCCIVAWQVLWLLPQIFFLFGLMEGLANEGLDEFFLSHVVESMRSYGPSFNDCVLGFGNFL